MQDYPEPPPIHALSLYFPHRGWKKRARNYTTDIRKAGTGTIQVWEVEVKAELPDNEVELSWVVEGKGVEGLRLRDVEGNEVIRYYRVQTVSLGRVRTFLS